MKPALNLGAWRYLDGSDGGPDLIVPAQHLLEPPIDEIGALPVNGFMKGSERRALAAAMNSLLASPTFASWRQEVK